MLAHSGTRQQCNVSENTFKNRGYGKRSKLSKLHRYRNSSLFERSQAKRSISVFLLFDNVEKRMHKSQMQWLFFIKCSLHFLSTTILETRTVNHKLFSCSPQLSKNCTDASKKATKIALFYLFLSTISEFLTYGSISRSLLFAQLLSQYSHQGKWEVCEASRRGHNHRLYLLLAYNEAAALPGDWWFQLQEDWYCCTHLLREREQSLLVTLTTVHTNFQRLQFVLISTRLCCKIFWEQLNTIKFRRYAWHKLSQSIILTSNTRACSLSDKKPHL